MNLWGSVNPYFTRRIRPMFRQSKTFLQQDDELE